jgi:hypothetical protein
MFKGEAARDEPRGHGVVRRHHQPLHEAGPLSRREEMHRYVGI